MVERLLIAGLLVGHEIFDCERMESGMAARSERIESDPDICHGKPCIRGLRYPVENLADLLASGMTIDDVLDDYPDLEREDLLAVVEYTER